MPFRINTNIDALERHITIWPKLIPIYPHRSLELPLAKNCCMFPMIPSGFKIGTSLEGKLKIMEGALGNISAAKDLLSTSESNLMGVNDLLTKIEGKLSDATNPTADQNSN